MEEFARLYRALLLTVAALIELSAATYGAGKAAGKNLSPLVKTLYTESKNVGVISDLIARCEGAVASLVNKVTSTVQLSAQLKTEKEEALLQGTTYTEEEPETITVVSTSTETSVEEEDNSIGNSTVENANLTVETQQSCDLTHTNSKKSSRSKTARS